MNVMTTEEAINYYGGKFELAKVLNCWPTAFYNWGDYPPMAKQYELEVKSNGQLKAEKVHD
jgi:hypothetical protein